MASPEIYQMAGRLLAFEARSTGSSDATGEAALRVIEGVQLRLIKLTGVNGFRSLLSRALALATAEISSLSTVTINEDGSLQGLKELEQDENLGPGRAGAALVAHLLDLLVTFIGESLTLRLLRDRWPDVSMNGAELKTGEKA
jgi:hypothetical protein